MLAIRMQRTGRSGHAMFRVIVQDSRRTPTSGKVVAQLGSYDPHTKATTINKEKAGFYLDHGAQPSDRVARLLKKEGVKLPEWVKLATDKERTVRNADKRRSTRPAEVVTKEAPATDATEAESTKTEAVTEEAPITDAASEAETDGAEISEAKVATKTPEAAEETSTAGADKPTENETPAESTEAAQPTGENAPATKTSKKS